MLTAGRALGFGLRTIAVDPGTRAVLDDAAAALRSPQAPPPPMPDWSTPQQAFLRERAHDLRTQYALAREGMRTLTEGVPGGRRVRLGLHYDVVGALLNATRTIIAAGLAAVFCVLSGWSESVLLLEILAAFTALLSMQTSPSAATINFASACRPARLRPAWWDTCCCRSSPATRCSS